jgi:uncharacterized OB-fold protein
VRRCAVSAARCLLQCLSVDLAWRETAREGTVIAETRIHASPDPYYRERLPWRRAGAARSAGPTVLCHLHGDVGRGDTIRMDLKLDKAGQGVMIALPQERTDAWRTIRSCAS